MKPKSTLSHFLAIAGSAALTIPHAQAATLYWDGNNTTANADGGVGTWTDGTSNWDNSLTAGTDTAWSNTNPDSAVFGVAGGAVTLGSNITVGGIQFNTSSTSIQTTSSFALTIGSGGINIAAGSGNQIGTTTGNTGRIDLGASQTWTNNSNQNFFHNVAAGNGITLGANTLTIAGNGNSTGGIVLNGLISGTGGLTVDSGGFADVYTTNTYSGVTTIKGSFTTNLLNNSNTASGFGQKASNLASNLVIDGGILNIQVSNTTSDRLFTMGAGGATLNATLTGVNSGQIRLTNTAAIAYTGVGNRTLNIGGNSDDTGGSSIALAINDVGGGNGIVSLSKAGSHSWTVSGTNAFSGGTTVSAGTLTMGSSSALGSTSGQLTVNGGTLNMASQSLTVGNLTGSGGIISGTSGTRLLTIGQGDNGGGNFQGQINNGAGGTTALTKTGSGTITLSGTNGYTGATNVSGGKLVVNGSISTSTLTTVQTGATLGGSGAVGALTVLANGTIAPGNSPDGLDVIGAYTQLGIYQADVTGNTPGNGTTGYDQVNVTGAVDISGGSLTTLFSGTGYAANDLLFILLNDGADVITGTYTGLAQGDVAASYGGFDWQISYTGNSAGTAFTGGNDIALMAVAAVPEPRAALLGSLGLLVLLRRRR